MTDRTTLSRLGAFAALLALATPGLAQDPAPKPAEKEKAPEPIVLPVPGQERTAQDEMVELFHNVERRLKEIDDLLYDAGAGDTSKLSEVSESGIDDLLNLSVSKSKEVVKCMDRILEIAEDNGGSCQNAMQQGQGSSTGGSPLDQQRSDRPEGEKESTPEQPSQGQQPQPQQQDDGQPKDPRDSDDPARNSPGQPPVPGETRRVAAPEGNERWGDLPIHVRDLFRNEGGRDLPPQYRDWIDAYHRRLNERP